MPLTQLYQKYKAQRRFRVDRLTDREKHLLYRIRVAKQTVLRKQASFQVIFGTFWASITHQPGTGYEPTFFNTIMESKGICWYCKKTLPSTGYVYLCGGGVVDHSAEFDRENLNLSPDDNLLRLESYVSGYLGLGYHTNPDCYSVDRSIVEDASYGQFEIPFCSFVCFREWINEMVDDLEQEFHTLMANCDCP